MNFFTNRTKFLIKLIKIFIKKHINLSFKRIFIYTTLHSSLFAVQTTKCSDRAFEPWAFALFSTHALTS
ncbi:hypothetical protein NBO_34g0002 [Nosema bombycis CQ1]|uniref:Uncharacterized protein n=1 Tax=Nosema bombycis (strain CQ1 / CVCC 102059) TaxID=578461 RepID=R0KVA3_NOSB1|nr:hypothetical protein NBO_34g0002 [Nosema bombycis CQ1]|eukprot:EOB14152.1 hypothetical protein NBO_34g0002 [Nosema bombycis CQ1]